MITLYQLDKTLSSCNESLYSSVDRAQRIIEKLKGPFPEEAPAAPAIAQMGLLNSTEKKLNDTVTAAYKLADVLADIETALFGEENKMNAGF